MTLAQLAVLCVALAPLALAASARAQSPPRVVIEGGSVVGVRTGNLASYKGIPFAAPPVRELRWRAPQPVAAWQGDLVADRFAPMCLQPLRPKNSVFYPGEEASSEDCLYLNVWSTAAAGDRRPVMVFVYGGGGPSARPRCRSMAAKAWQARVRSSSRSTIASARWASSPTPNPRPKRAAPRAITA